MKIVSTIENYLVSGLWLEIGKEIDVLEEDLHKYLYLNGIKILEKEQDKEQEKEQELNIDIKSDIENKETKL